MSDVSNIVREYLVAHGYDGLVSSVEQCGCGLDDFMPCTECDILHCLPAHKVVIDSAECKACAEYEDNCDIRHEKFLEGRFCYLEGLPIEKERKSKTGT